MRKNSGNGGSVTVIARGSNGWDWSVRNRYGEVEGVERTYDLACCKAQSALSMMSILAAVKRASELCNGIARFTVRPSTSWIRFAGPWAVEVEG